MLPQAILWLKRVLPFSQ
ncbi:hypothetical protein YPPY58_2816, partial [Yersinia pestis PY-58]